MKPLHNLVTLVLLYTPAAYSSAGPRYIFTFGDSYTDTGFDSTKTHPSQSNPLGNPAKGNHTSCSTSSDPHCANWIEVLTTELSATNTLSYNYARGGAVINNKDSRDGAIYNYTSELSEWTQYLAGKPSYASWTGSNSVAIAWFGVNDVNSIGQNSNNYKTDITNEFKDLFIDFQWMYNYGVRNFLVLNCPPFTRNPSYASSGNLTNLQNNITYWNNLLPSKAQDFATTNNDCEVKVVDTFAPFNSILNNPSKYPSPWADNIHPAKDIQRAVANTVHDALNAIGFYS